MKQKTDLVDRVSKWCQLESR